MALPLTASWIALVVCALILGISAICLIGTETGKEEVGRVEEKVEKKVFYIKSQPIINIVIHNFFILSKLFGFSLRELKIRLQFFHILYRYDEYHIFSKFLLR